MTLKKRMNALVKEIAKREGGRVQLDAPQIREVIKCIAIINAECLIASDLKWLTGYSTEHMNEPHIRRIAMRNVKARRK